MTMHLQAILNPNRTKRGTLNNYGHRTKLPAEMARRVKYLHSLFLLKNILLSKSTNLPVQPSKVMQLTNSLNAVDAHVPIYYVLIFKTIQLILSTVRVQCTWYGGLNILARSYLRYFKLLLTLRTDK